MMARDRTFMVHRELTLRDLISHKIENGPTRGEYVFQVSTT